MVKNSINNFMNVSMNNSMMPMSLSYFIKERLLYLAVGKRLNKRLDLVKKMTSNNGFYFR